MDLLQRQRCLVLALLLILVPCISSALSQDNSASPPGLQLDLPEGQATDLVSPPAPANNSTTSKFENLSLDSLDTGSGTSKSDSGVDTDTNFSTSELTETEELTSSWNENLRVTVDVANRSLFLTGSGDYANLALLGIDLHRVFTTDQGDIGTLILQPFLTRSDNLQTFPSTLFDDPYDWTVQWRISNFNYTGLGRGKPNIRIGSFELPFGLEQIINTNGTIRDYTHFQNFGIKTDWGMTLNGETNDVEYELALSRGSGNPYRRRGDPFLLAGRVGTTRDKPVILGISGLHGETVNFNGDSGTTRRSRLGIDMTFADERIVYMAEATAGFQDDAQVFSGLIEFDTFNRDESILLYNQFFVRGLSETDVWDYEIRDSIGVRWQVDNHWALSTQVSHFFDVIGNSNGNGGTNVSVQARYRF